MIVESDFFLLTRIYPRSITLNDNVSHKCINLLGHLAFKVFRVVKIHNMMWVMTPHRWLPMFWNTLSTSSHTMKTKVICSFKKL